jgi:hypothetical protein
MDISIINFEASYNANYLDTLSREAFDIYYNKIKKACREKNKKACIYNKLIFHHQTRSKHKPIANFIGGPTSLSLFGIQN